jgi:hypothetical protein
MKKARKAAETEFRSEYSGQIFGDQVRGKQAAPFVAPNFRVARVTPPAVLFDL